MSDLERLLQGDLNRGNDQQWTVVHRALEEAAHRDLVLPLREAAMAEQDAMRRNQLVVMAQLSHVLHLQGAALQGELAAYAHDLMPQSPASLKAYLATVREFGRMCREVRR